MKKKRIVKLEPQTVELFAEVLSKLRPPPPLTVSQWADRYRVLSAESSAEPGRWHTEKAPYQRAIMNAIGDPHVRSVVVMSAAQIGKTDAFINNRPVSQNPFMLEKVADEWGAVHRFWGLTSGKLTLTLKEYT